MSGVAVAPGRRDDVDIERDRELVERAQAGDADAFGDLYLRYFDRLCRFCFRRLGNMSESEDAAQESFTRAWKALPRFDGERRLYPWLSVIAANVCTDIVRRRSRSKVVVDEPDLERVAVAVDGGQEDIVERSDSDLLYAALRRISPRHREVLRLRESYEWSYQRIAEYQGVEVSTIETLLFRARRSLRREFMALAEAQGALGGAVLLALKRGFWKVRHLGAPAGAAKSAVPAIAGAGAGAGGSGAALGAGAVAALIAVGALTGSTMIVRHAPAQPVAAVHHGMSAQAAAALANARNAQQTSSGHKTAAAAGHTSSHAAPGQRSTGGAAAGGAHAGSGASSVSQLTAPATSTAAGPGSAVSQTGSKVQQLGTTVTQTVNAEVQAVNGVVRTAGGIVKSVVSLVKKVVPLPLPPVTVPPVTSPAVTVPPVTLPTLP